jgi:hypothetical protein
MPDICVLPEQFQARTEHTQQMCFLCDCERHQIPLSLQYPFLRIFHGNRSSFKNVWNLESMLLFIITLVDSYILELCLCILHDTERVIAKALSQTAKQDNTAFEFLEKW